MSLTVIHLAALILAQAPVDSTKPRPISQMVHTTWTTNDGAPTEVNAFAQTLDGYLWIGTRSGLVRFDGVRFAPFSVPTGDTLPTGSVSFLRATRDGSLWVVSASGWVSRIRDGRVTSFGERNGLPSTIQLAESRSGTLLAATTNGIRRFSGGIWNDIAPEWKYTGGDTKAIWFDREDALWVEAHDRFLYLPAGANRFVDPGMKLLLGSERGEFAETNDGAIWFSEIYRSAHTIPRIGDSRPVSEVMGGTLHLVVDRRGSLWIGSVGGGLRRLLDPTTLRGGKITPSDTIGEKYAEKEGLLSGIVNAIFEDRESNIWVGTDRGIERFRESAFTPFPSSAPPRARFVFASRDTSVWSATFGYNGIIRIHAGRRDSIPTLTVLREVAEDRSGTLWFAVSDRVGWIKDRRMANAWVGTPGANYNRITADSTGRVWVFEGGYGLGRVTVTGVVRADSLPVADRSLTARRMFADREGRIWTGHVGRVSMTAGDGLLRVFGPEQGMLAGAVTGFLEDHAGNIWVLGDGGISRFERDHFRSLTRRQSLPGRSVYGVAEDASRAWWVVTSRGVLRLEPGELDRALADSNYLIKYRSFGVPDGIPGMLSGSAWGPQVTRAPDGRIWVAGDSGIASIDPRNIPNDAPPEVLIEAARVGGREQTWPTTAIGPRIGDLEIDYTAPVLANPERIQFRYRLEGADTAWHDVGGRRRAYFTGLTPGSYKFRVSARNGDGPWSEAGAVWSFHVLPAWYQTPWFRAAVILMFGGLIAVGSGMLQRRRDLQAREKLRNEYEATLAERARIAQDLHDTLLQGFIGVTVQIQAAESALSNQPYAAQTVLAERLARASLLARAALQEARERVWDMREELGTDDLAAALEASAREWTAGSGVQIAVITTGQRRRLSGRVEDAAFRIGREAIINALQHADARCIEIRVEFGPGMVRLDVADDGRGFSAEEAEEARRKGHFGLSGARERAGFNGGRFDVRPRPGGGTIVSLELPLQNTPKDVSSLSASSEERLTVAP